MKKVYETIDEFKEDLYKEYNLKEIGIILGWFKDSDFVGNKITCPFHNNGHERTPSCQIGDTWYRCYGCGSKGDLFSFGMKIENLSFTEIVFEISKAIGVTINATSKLSEQEKIRRELKHEWIQYVEDFKTEIKTNEKLKNRYEKLFPLECGFDKKENRIVVPYTDINGNILGFTKRRINEEDEPKWKHSNLNNSLIDLCGSTINFKVLKNEEQIYLVEGPGDVSGMCRNGYLNTVGICGTSHFNTKLLNLIDSNYQIKSLILVFDGDAPGLEATLKACELTILNKYLLAEKSFVVILPEGIDPGEISKEVLDECIVNKIPMVEYYLSQKDTSELKLLFKKSYGKIIKSKIVEFIMKQYEINKEEALQLLESNSLDFMKEMKDSIKKNYNPKDTKDLEVDDFLNEYNDEQKKTIMQRKIGRINNE